MNSGWILTCPLFVGWDFAPTQQPVIELATRPRAPSIVRDRNYPNDERTSDHLPIDLPLRITTGVRDEMKQQPPTPDPPGFRMLVLLLACFAALAVVAVTLLRRLQFGVE